MLCKDFDIRGMIGENVLKVGKLCMFFVCNKLRLSFHQFCIRYLLLLSSEILYLVLH
jgi:hypothetical protein